MKGWTRRGLGAAGLGIAAAPAYAAPVNPLDGDVLYADVKTYAAFGDHRTGTAGDQACTAWLERALKAAGYEVERQGFDYPVFEVGMTQIAHEGRLIDGFPLWTPKAETAIGNLATESGKLTIALLSLPYGTGAALETSAAWRGPVQAAIDGGANGVVVVTEHPLGELAAYNCAPNQRAWRVPVMAVAGREGAFLKSRIGQPFGMVVDGKTISGRGENVVARMKGAGKPLVISTPKSGWFTCAGERGSGLAIWLGLARRLRKSGRNLIFTANSGHEFDGYGGKLFADRLAPKPADARGWVHIGANVAAYDFALIDGKITRLEHPQPVRRLAVSEALLPTATKAFAGQFGYAKPVDVDKDGAPGELAEYQKRGYAPLVGMVALHPLHHTRRDLPDVTEPELLEPVARGLLQVIDRL